MRILFIARRFSYLKNFEGPVFELVRRGHHVHIVALGGEGKIEGTALVERWAEREPAITYQRIPEDIHEELKIGVRGSISMMVDYVRYLEPQYQSADGLVVRARRRTPLGFLRLTERPIFRWPAVRRAVLWVLRQLEASAPRPSRLEAFLREQAPDVVMFTPLIGLQSAEQDVLAAAVRQRLRTVFCVLSWDNLSSKAIIRTVPDLVMVWNDVQRDEARTLHGVPPDRIAVTGAQTFDLWFNREPSRPRAAFLERVGLPTDRPFLLWVCSSLFRTSPVEARFVRQWIEAIRAADDPRLRDVSILVRPHPSRMLEWARVPLADLGPVSLWGAAPVDTDSRDDYFDSLYYSEAVVGLNTSAFLEAAIVGRPVHTVLLPEFHESQEGTLHFSYLLNVAGGLLHTSRDMATHIATLAAALGSPEAAAERSERFVKAFIRPHGLERSASVEFVDAIERLLERPAQRAAVRRGGPLFSSLYAWLDRSHPTGRVREWLTSENEIEHRTSREEKLARAAKKAARRIAASQARAAAAADVTRAAPAADATRAAEEHRRRKQERLQRHRAEKQAKRAQEAAR